MFKQEPLNTIHEVFLLVFYGTISILTLLIEKSTMQL